MKETCSHNKCYKRPSFGYKNSKIKYCKRHSSNDMINITKKLCSIDICTNIAIYNNIYNTKLYCNLHNDTNIQ